MATARFFHGLRPYCGLPYSGPWVEETEQVFHNGHLFCPAFPNREDTALAIRYGRILATGRDREILKLASSRADVVDLKGDTIIPGLIDAHAHPAWAGKLLLFPYNLGNVPMSVRRTMKAIRAYLEQDEARLPIEIATDRMVHRDNFLCVMGWKRKGGAELDCRTLDNLPTRRPIMVYSNDCHFLALNTRAMEELKLLNVQGALFPYNEHGDGRYVIEEGLFHGLAEDGPAMRLFDVVTGLESPKEAALPVAKAQESLNSEGVTTVMDARVREESLRGWTWLRDNKRLRLRVCGAAEIEMSHCLSLSMVPWAVKNASGLARRWRAGQAGDPQPGISIRQAKLFLDGMPGNGTAFMQIPYERDFLISLRNKGLSFCGNHPELSGFRGRPYYSPEILEAIFIECAKEGLWPHCHAIGDGAAEMAIAAAKETRKRFGEDTDLRPSVAHLEFLAPNQAEEFAKAGLTALLSFQWAGLSRKEVKEIVRIYGKRRLPGLELQARFKDCGARIAYGSDWPIDPLGQWKNFRVGLSRRPWSEKGKAGPRLENDRDLSLAEIISAATLGAAWTLGLEKEIGSLEPGKLADLCQVRGNIFGAGPKEVGQAKVARTIVGGRMVYED
jgi:predicted amidohydrolase YtcJ